MDEQIWSPLHYFWVELECTAHPNPSTVVGELSVLIEVRIGVEPNPVHSFEIFAIPSDLLFLKLPFAARPGLTGSRVSKSLGF